jgi:hypothetical protein
MEKGDRVRGKYFGAEFSGVVQGVWYWNGWQRGYDSVFVKLDSPIVVHGEQRDAISVGSPKSGYVRKEA